MGRSILAAALILAGGTAWAQDVPAEQQARVANDAAGGAAIYDMVAADRETAWRINRVTGEVVVCRIDTTSSLDAARARCAPAVHETAPQQSRVPAGRP